ncbi:MAG: 50S ribosomal protein L25 [Candidatus Wolfebacteria bacterium GW2011_GWA2_47_9b]|uniref:50S ribosomal protein L25 n=1 Tax=Candidatus Wolfebacteria bacterium GW2011_GWA2_47_9b TaxID=1619005 RepID=A0A0G1U2M8_9BACT|nr:MAG: 50S ribosomal protein L25 [Candidatus Wolfebacteria bacterium GW2011_GWA2_47_9b]
MNEVEFGKVYKEGGENTIVNVKFDNESRSVLVHSVQFDQVNQKVLAVDLYQVNLSEKITTNVPLEFVGESNAVKEMAGVLIKALDEVEVEALPMNIPHSIQVDISVLDDFTKSITIADLKIEGNFEIKTDPDAGVASVAEPRVEEEPVAEINIEDIEVEAKGKKESEEEIPEGEKPSGRE